MKTLKRIAHTGISLACSAGIAYNRHLAVPYAKLVCKGIARLAGIPTYSGGYWGKVDREVSRSLAGLAQIGHDVVEGTSLRAAASRASAEYTEYMKRSIALLCVEELSTTHA